MVRLWRPGLKQLNMIKSSDLFIIKRSELKILFSKSIPNLHYLLFKQHIFFSSYRVGESFLLYWETLFLAKGPHSVRSDWSSSTDWVLDWVEFIGKTIVVIPSRKDRARGTCSIATDEKEHVRNITTFSIQKSIKNHLKTFSFSLFLVHFWWIGKNAIWFTKCRQGVADYHAICYIFLCWQQDQENLNPVYLQLDQNDLKMNF